MAKIQKLQAVGPVVKKSRRGFLVYKTNPFLVDLAIEVQEQKLTIARGAQIVDGTGEKVADATICQIKKVDNEQFVKLYTSNMQVFFDLTKNGVKLLAIFFMAIQESAIGKDEVLVSFSEAQRLYDKSCGLILSRSTYDRGIHELIEKNFIAESPRSNDVFYINPNLVFNGDRVRFVTEYRKTDAYREAEEELLTRIKESKELKQGSLL